MGIVGQRSPLRVTQRSRHPEVHQESPTSFESPAQILATAPNLGHALPDELAADDHRVERPYETCIANLDVLEACPLEDGSDGPAHGLDLGQLRHVPSLGASPLAAGAGTRPRRRIDGTALSSPPLRR
jgi:hypothetical protein